MEPSGFAGSQGESYLRLLIRSLPDLLFVFDQDGRILDVKADARDLHTSPQQFLGRRYEDVLPADVADCLREAIAETTSTRDLVRIEYDIPIGDTSRSFSGTVVPFGEGGTLAVVRDVTEQKRMEEGLRREMELQNLLMTIASKYINTRPGDVRRAIDDSLAEIALFVHADRSYIFDYDWEHGICRNTHEWCADGISPQIDQLQRVPLAWVPQWVETHLRGETMYVPDVSALPQDDGVRQILEPQDVKSLIAIPVIDAERCVGFVGFDSVLRHYRYSERERILLSVFAQILVNIRTRATLEERIVEESQKAQAANRAKSQ
ncbi:MAG: PAS domain-containing protein, partial [Vicinamibacterales bacterium]|nr:PAS domain-containing protein [Vicinamibacterales bacterium]